MAQAKTGDKVKVHYRGTLEDGSVFDSSFERDQPLEFTIGEKKLLPGFENAVVGMEAGAEKSVTIRAADAYGLRQEHMTAVVKSREIPPHIQLKTGTVLQVETEEGRPMMLTVTRIDGEDVTLDANHPLAGKDLVFKIQLVQILP